jgi:hypothetical protein
MLEHISPEGYDSWCSVLWAIHRAAKVSSITLEDGQDVANEWSQRGSNYSGRLDVVRKMREADKREDGPGIGFLWNQAKAGGWEPTAEQKTRLHLTQPEVAAGANTVAEPTANVVTDTAPRFKTVALEAIIERPLTEWIVPGILPKAALVMIYGPSGSGKSFFAYNMCLAIAEGRSWYGIETRKTRVLWIAAEAKGSMRSRTRAYLEHHKLSASELPGIRELDSTPPDLFDPADVGLFIEALKANRVELVCFDTLAAVSAGADENSGQDMGRLIGALQRIHAETGASIVCVHHSGKDKARGARGWSGIRAAVDTEIEISRDEADPAIRRAKITKHRDGEDGQALFFKLAKVGESCVVEFTGPPERPEREAKHLHGRVAGLVLEVLNSSPGATLNQNELISAAAPKLAHDPQKRDQRRAQVARALDRLAQAKLVSINDSEVRITAS